MAKTRKFVRVAVSVPTIDGRTIDADQLIQAAKNYDPNTYAARANVEHVRGITGQSPFKTVGDVRALKAEPVTINIGGKPEQRTGLFAQIDAHDDLLALNKDGQKLYTSIELLPNYAGTNEAYMVGLAVTDSPASLGTERLQFTANAKAYGNLVSTPVDLNLEFEAPAPSQTAATDAFTAMGNFFKSLVPVTPVQPPAGVVTPTTPAEDTMAVFTNRVTEGLSKMAVALEAGQKANAESTAAVAADLAAFKTQLATTPATAYTARPVATGGTGAVLAEC